jgi:pyruvate/2-oxoglutarate dehydrogenase complex dihydrolipoamide acyltransferase (E2) component
VPVIRDAYELSPEGLATRIVDLAERARSKQLKRPVVVTDADGRDSIAVRPMAYLCMSWDHRALDGALAARFLSTLTRLIEGPSA